MTTIIILGFYLKINVARQVQPRCADNIHGRQENYRSYVIPIFWRLKIILVHHLMKEFFLLKFREKLFSSL